MPRYPQPVTVAYGSLPNFRSQMSDRQSMLLMEIVAERLACDWIGVRLDDRAIMSMQLAVDYLLQHMEPAFAPWVLPRIRVVRSTPSAIALVLNGEVKEITMTIGFASEEPQQQRARPTYLEIE